MSLIERDLRHIWHPASQMKDYEAFPPVEIVDAEGSYLITASGQRIIDAISSWWCKSLGHRHPRLTQALIRQAQNFEHVIGANTCVEPVVELGEKLATLMPPLNKVFFASDGSSAVEIALKLSLQAQQLKGQSQRTRFIALSNGYHGETVGALSVSDCGVFKKPFESLLWKTHFIEHVPYVKNRDNPLWSDCSRLWPAIELSLEAEAEHTAAIILEPLVQGAGGMQIYSADFLSRLAAWAKAKDIFLIADEIMTGFGRTGRTLACEHAGIQPDLICLGKGLTGGYLPMSAVLIHQDIYDLFYGEFGPRSSFFHSHTHTGNALAAAVACAALHAYDDLDILQQVQAQEPLLQRLMQEVAEKTEQLRNLRSIGAIVAADLINPQGTPRLGYQVFQTAIQKGAWLRPIGNTIYWLPPLNTNAETLTRLAEITAESLKHFS